MNALETLEISLTVNGEQVKRSVPARLNLADFLRNELELTGTHVGCKVDTIEGLSDSREIEELQSAFVLTNALQCGFCTPGVLMAAQALLRDETNPSRERIREYLSGNYCRCTGYQAIVDAIEAVAKARTARSK